MALVYVAQVVALGLDADETAAIVAYTHNLQHGSQVRRGWVGRGSEATGMGGAGDGMRRG